jgi:DNA polymerase-3 subunit epsilon
MHSRMNQDDQSNTAALEAAGEVRVLRKLPRRRTFLPADGPTRIGVLLDIETTGLDLAVDGIIELRMLKFTFVSDGRVFDVVDEFSALRELAVRIPAEVIQLTGVTAEMVAGKTIDCEAAARFIDDAVLVIAHEARFDRPFCERLVPAFTGKYWPARIPRSIGWHAATAAPNSPTSLMISGTSMTGTGQLMIATRCWRSSPTFLPGADGSSFGTLLKNARKASVRL